MQNISSFCDNTVNALKMSTNSMKSEKRYSEKMEIEYNIYY